MNNISTWDDFKNKKNTTISSNETIETIVTTEDNVNESAQLIDDVWKVRTRFEIPTSLVNAFIKKVKDECNRNVRENFSDQEIAEEIASYVKSAFLNIANLPSSIIVGEKTEASPKAQVQDGQAQTQGEDQAQTQGQGQGQSQGQSQGQGKSQGQSQTQGQGQSQGQAQSKTEKTSKEVPAQEI